MATVVVALGNKHHNDTVLSHLISLQIGNKFVLVGIVRVGNCPDLELAEC